MAALSTGALGASRADGVTPAPASKILAWEVSKQPAHRSVEAGLPNFGKLNDHVWRSGQPTAAGYKTLEELHVKTIVNLRVEYPQEEQNVRDLVKVGVHYFWIPIKDQGVPTAEQARKFLDIVADPSNWPVLVHCEGGEGRAGIMSALVRYSFDGWDNATIMKEVGNFRKAYLGFIKLPMPANQRSFIQHWEESSPAGQYCKLAKQD